jgi:AraC-like DNA-binding protein
MYCELVDVLLGAERLEPGRLRLSSASIDPAAPSLENRVHDYLLTHRGDAVDLVDVAKSVGVSVSTLSHKYHHATGESPMKTLTRLRIEFSRDLLLKGYTLKHIAEQAGFCNEFHLSKAFKHLTGQSPREYRNRRRDD